MQKHAVKFRHLHLNITKSQKIFYNIYINETAFSN